MTLNFPGPYQLRMYYTTTPTGMTPFQHVAKYNINVTGTPPPGTLFSAITIVRRDGIPQTLQSYVDAWVVLVRPVFGTAANNTIDFFELWEYTPGTFDASFLSAYAVNLAGTTALSANPAGESIITYRTLEGGIMKMSFLEGTGTAQAVDTPPFLSGVLDAIQVFVSGVTNAFLGADTSYPFATRALFPGQNEALFKKRFRTI